MKYLMKLNFFTESRKYINSEPEIGDYVIISDKNSDSEFYKNFISTNIGQIININFNNTYSIYHQQINTPQKVYTIRYLKTKNMDNFFKMWNKYMTTLSTNEEIIFFSPNKEDCEAFLTTKKYNV